MLALKRAFTITLLVFTTVKCYSQTNPIELTDFYQLELFNPQQMELIKKNKIKRIKEFEGKKITIWFLDSKARVDSVLWFQKNRKSKKVLHRLVFNYGKVITVDFYNNINNNKSFDSFWLDSVGNLLKHAKKHYYYIGNKKHRTEISNYSSETYFRTSIPNSKNYLQLVDYSEKEFRMDTLTYSRISNHLDSIVFEEKDNKLYRKWFVKATEKDTFYKISFEVYEKDRKLLTVDRPRFGYKIYSRENQYFYNVDGMLIYEMNKFHEKIFYEYSHKGLLKRRLVMIGNSGKVTETYIRHF